MDADDGAAGRRGLSLRQADIDEAQALNAQVLEEMAARGDDLFASREMEFAHLFADRVAATAFCDWAHRAGYAADIWCREDGEVDVIVCRDMVPELAPLTELELVLAAAAQQHGGKADGWGCFAVPIPG